MDRTGYLKQTKDLFKSQTNESPYFPDHFEPLNGIFRVLEIFCGQEQQHPKYTEIPLILKCKCIWKPAVEDDFLEEFIRWFDFTQLIHDWKLLDNILAEYQNDPDDKAVLFSLFCKHKDVQIQNNSSGNWEFIDKINRIIVSDETGKQPFIRIGKRLTPLPEISSSAKIFSFSKVPIDFSSGIYPEDAEIIHITDENNQEVWDYQIGPSLYFQSLNEFRNKYGTQMADTVPVKGYYKIYAIRLDPPRKIERIINGEKRSVPAPYDSPCRFIGIGHWLGPHLSESDPLKFNPEITVEIRLNPLFNKAATIKGLSTDFPREKIPSTYYSIFNQGIIKINDIKLEDNSYVIDWEVIYHSDFVKTTGIPLT